MNYGWVQPSECFYVNWLIQEYYYCKKCHLSSSTNDELYQEFVIQVLLIVKQYPT